MREPVPLIFRVAFVVAAAAVAYLAVTPVPYPGMEEVSDKIRHAFAFYTLALLLDFAVPRRGFGVAKIGALLMYGAAIEIAQHFLPWRQASILDLAADAAGLLIYAISLPLLARVPVLGRRWDRSDG